MQHSIRSFHGEHRFLSNFWPAKVVLDGQAYPTVEHAYVAAKTLDLALRKRVQECESAGAAKRLGRKINLRADWETVKLSVMEELLRQKFSHPDLRERLLATGSVELIEGNTWGDEFWGVCNNRGLNHLGRLLMKIRADLLEVDLFG